MHSYHFHDAGCPDRYVIELFCRPTTRVRKGVMIGKEGPVANVADGGGGYLDVDGRGVTGGKSVECAI